MLLATIQIVAGLVIGIFSAFAATCNPHAREVCKQAFRHVAHGFGNVCASIFEMIPIIGTVFYYIREWRIPPSARVPGPHHTQGLYIVLTGQDDKYMAYASLINFTVKSADTDTVVEGFELRATGLDRSYSLMQSNNTAIPCIYAKSFENTIVTI